VSEAVWTYHFRRLNPLEAASVPVDCVGSKSHLLLESRSPTSAEGRRCTVPPHKQRQTAASDSSGNPARRSSLQVNCSSRGIRCDARMRRRVLHAGLVRRPCTSVVVHAGDCHLQMRSSLYTACRTLRPRFRASQPARKKMRFSPVAVLKLSAQFYYTAHVVDSFDERRRVLNMNERTRPTARNVLVAVNLLFKGK